MEFPFNFKLLSGTKIDVVAEVTQDEALIGITIPMSFGDHLDGLLMETHIQREQIEARAIEIYKELRLGDAR